MNVWFSLTFSKQRKYKIQKFVSLVLLLARMGLFVQKMACTLLRGEFCFKFSISIINRRKNIKAHITFSGTEDGWKNDNDRPRTSVSFGRRTLTRFPYRGTHPAPLTPPPRPPTRLPGFCWKRMLQAYVSSVLNVSEVCCNCLIWMLQK